MPILELQISIIPLAMRPYHSGDRRVQHMCALSTNILDSYQNVGLSLPYIYHDRQDKAQYHRCCYIAVVFCLSLRPQLPKV